MLFGAALLLPARAAACSPEALTDSAAADSASLSAEVRTYLEQTYDVSFSENNRLVVFKNGQEKFDDLFAAVRQAKKSIHLEYFNFRNDSISELLFSLLAERAKAGVKVRALFDGFGNSSNNRPLRKKHLTMLRSQGIEIYEFDPLRFPWINHALHRDHRKIVVIDGTVAYTGGMNVADYYINGKEEFGEWRDVHARVEGDAVGELQKIFIDFWNRTTGQDISGSEYYPGEKDATQLFVGLAPDVSADAGAKTVAVVNRDHKVAPRIIHNTFVNIIDNCREHLQIINPYFTLCRHIKRALKRAVRRGVEVEIMVSEKSDIPITPRVVEYNVHRLMKCGAKVYFFQGGFHHSKILMADGEVSFLGSANLNSRSLSFDYECNLVVLSRETTQQLQAIFDTDKTTRCFRLTEETWKKNFSRGRRRKGWWSHFLTPFVYLPPVGTNSPHLCDTHP